MKKTSNKILVVLLIVTIIIGMSFILFVKVKGGREIKNKSEVVINYK